MESVLTKRQRLKFGPKVFTEDGNTFRIIANVRHDDECGNGHNTFSITADIQEKRGTQFREYSGGCCHDEVAKHFPKLAPFIKWHLTSTDGPMHYIANTVYLAGDKDRHGLRLGESRQFKDKESGLPEWILDVPYEFHHKTTAAAEKPEPATFQWKSWGRDGEGKERQLDAARSAAVWPEATDEDLTAPGLKKRLEARHATLMAEFQRDIESLGLVF